MQNAAVYVRISSDPSGRALGVARQEEDCRALAERRGWQIGKVYTDNDVSAFDKRKIRPGWQALLNDLRRGRRDAVVVYDMDRVARRTRDLDDLLDVYESRPNVGFAAVTGELDLASSGGRMVARMLVSVATKASEDTGRRVARKHLELAQQGLPAGGRRAFGYAEDFTTIIEAEAAAIREAAQRVIAGEPLANVMDDFDARGIKPTRADRWTRPSLKYVLTSERVAGRRRHQGKDIGKASWPAILDDETWNAVRAVLTGRASSPNLTNVRRYLLSGLAICGRCGTPVSTKVAFNTKKAAYACPAPRDGGCSGVYRTASKVDDLVTRVILGRLTMPDAAELFVDQGPSVTAAATEMVEVRDRLERLAIDFADGVLTAEQLRAITNRLRTRLDELQMAMTGSDTNLALEFMTGAGDPKERWTSLALTDQRQIVDTLVHIRILPALRKGKRFDPTSVKVEWKKS
jgi:site-specific DNA recombinase